MDKKFVKEILKVADMLDKKGLTAEADELDKIVKEAEMFGIPSYPSPGQSTDIVDRIKDRQKGLAQELSNKPLTDEKLEQIMNILAV